MLSSADQLGKIIHLPAYPNRIISLVPSQTELLYDLGMDDEVVGITKFCIHPDRWFRNKTRVGGTKNIKIELIHSLKPDLIIANKEENTKEQVESLAKIYPVWISDVHDIETALQMILSVGGLVNKQQTANLMAEQIKEGLNQLQNILHERKLAEGKETDEIRTAYIIWKDPYMTIGGDTFIHDMLKACGLKNIFENFIRYPETDIAALRQSNCKLLLLSSEPYPFTRKHTEELQKLLPGTKIILVDGEMFSWYGSRLIQATGYLRKLLMDII